MLSDLERKVLVVLFNVYGNNWVSPNIHYISRLSQRTPQQVKLATQGLSKSGHVEINEGKMRVIQMSEPTSVKKSYDGGLISTYKK